MTESSKQDFGWFSTSELAKLGAARVVKLPGTLAGISNRAREEHWEKRQVPGKGGKGGLKTEYKLREPALSIAETFLRANPEFFQTSYAKIAVTPLTSGLSPSHHVSNDGGDDIPAFLRKPSDTSKLMNKDDLHIVDYVEAYGSCGPGAMPPQYEEVTVVVKFEARELRERAIGNFHVLKLAHVKGDSMEPTLMHNDQVLVDTAVDTFIDDAIYAIQQDGHLRFKRIQKKMNGTIVIKSDNLNAGEPETYSADEAAHFKVIGRVIPFKFGRFKI